MVGEMSLRRYEQLTERIDAIGRRDGVTVDVVYVMRRSGYALPFFVVRTGPNVGRRICISAGVHGDEPAGVEALVSYLERPVPEQRVGIVALPCINPIGYIAGTRTNDLGVDLNRTFGQTHAPLEAEIVRAALGSERFDCAIDLHEDTEARGFYIYEHVRGDVKPACAAIVSAVRSVGLPISDAPTVEGRALVDGCVAPAEETLSPLIGFFSIYQFDRHSDHTLVPESPSILPIQARVAMHQTAIDVIVASLR
jgi:hypothetical protein